ncbi:hypothetical protein K4F52_010141, partial [Lecanicillium sp. MT-2017a]
MGCEHSGEATVFATDNVHQKLSDEISELNMDMCELESKIEQKKGALSLLERFEHGKNNLRASRGRESIGAIRHRAQRLGSCINNGQDTDEFVQEVRQLSRDELTFLAMVYVKTAKWDYFKAGYLRDYMKKHGLNCCGTDEFKSVGAMVKLAGGRCQQIYEAAKLEREADFRATTAELTDSHCEIVGDGSTASTKGLKRPRLETPADIISTPQEDSTTYPQMQHKEQSDRREDPISTSTVFFKGCVEKTFHPEAVHMFSQEKAYTANHFVTNIKIHMYPSKALCDIDVPNGFDPHCINIFKDGQRGNASIKSFKKIVVEMDKETGLQLCQELNTPVINKAVSSSTLLKSSSKATCREWNVGIGPHSEVLPCLYYPCLLIVQLQGGHLVPDPIRHVEVSGPSWVQTWGPSWVQTWGPSWVQTWAPSWVQTWAPSWVQTKGTELGTDQGTELGTDLGTELGTDQGTELGTDLGTELGTDQGTELGTDLGTELGTGQDGKGTNVLRRPLATARH